VPIPPNFEDVSPSAASEFFVARQPILDRAGRTVGYELLFRRDRQNRARVRDGAAATATVICHVFGELGVDAVLGPHLGFVNVDEALLRSDAIELLPPGKIVLELLETVRLTEQVLARVRALHAAGFTIALDDVAKNVAIHEPVLDCVAIAKVDLKRVGAAALPEVTARLARWPVRLLAEKVDSREQAERCLDLGYELFQGHHFARPLMLEGRKVAASEVVLRRLLALAVREPDSAEIEAALAHHPELGPSLIRLSRSLATASHAEASSLREAVELLGPRRIRRWLELLLHAGDRPGA
jgi:EAL and modified HD-GYP domain-containing signal transduction protein